MKYNIQFINTKASDKMEIMAIEKLDALAEKFNWAIKASVFFKKEEKDPANGSICEIKLSEAGPLLFASSNKRTFEMALKETLSDLTVQLKKRKDIMNDRNTISYKSA